MANVVKAGTSIQGCELTISGDDVVVADGAVNGVAIAGVTLDLSALSLADGENKVILAADGTTVTAVAAATALVTTQIQLGTYTSASDAASAVNIYNGRGNTLVVTLDAATSL